MGVPKRLTEMQRKFAEILVFGDKDGKAVTKTEAAKQAGFSPNRCRQEGYELTNPKLHPLVVDYIGKLREEKIQKYMLSSRDGSPPIKIPRTPEVLFPRFGENVCI